MFPQDIRVFHFDGYTLITSPADASFFAPDIYDIAVCRDTHPMQTLVKDGCIAQVVVDTLVDLNEDQFDTLAGAEAWAWSELGTTYPDEFAAVCVERLIAIVNGVICEESLDVAVESLRALTDTMTDPDTLQTIYDRCEPNLRTVGSRSYFRSLSEQIDSAREDTEQQAAWRQAREHDAVAMSRYGYSFQRINLAF